MSVRSRIGTVLALAAGLLLLPTAANAVALHQPHVGTTVECTGQVLWHFVHNQVAKGDSTPGTITATFEDAGAVVVGSNKQNQTVRHYDVYTPAGDTLLSASDNISGGNLVLSHTECTPGTPPPPDECISGTSVEVTWGDVRLGFWNMTGLQETASTGVSLLPGTYDVTLVSSDEFHAPGHQPEQDEEQWYVALYAGGMLVTNTGTVSDLPTDLMTITEMVGQISLPDGADTAVVTHKLAGQPYEAWDSPESIEPTTAIFTCV